MHADSSLESSFDLKCLDFWLGLSVAPAMSVMIIPWHSSEVDVTSGAQSVSSALDTSHYW